MSRILVAFHTHEGHTRKIADAIATEARRLGHDVVELELTATSEMGSLDDYDGIIVGGPVNRGHHDPALADFVVRHLEILERKPSAFFSVSLVAGSESAANRIDAQLVAQRFFHDTGWHPAIFACMAGALVYSKYGPALKQTMRLIAWMHDGPTDTSRDYELTDWDGVRRFARDVVTVVERGVTPQPAMLIDRYMPFFDFSVVREIVVELPPSEAFRAALETDLTSDPLVNALGKLRVLPERLLHRLRGEASEPEPERFTFGQLLRGGEGTFRGIAIEEDRELLAGAIGQFWKPVIAWRDFTPEQFRDFSEPGLARLAISLRVIPEDGGRSRLRYEARTAATDEQARRRFALYWSFMGRFAGLVMARALDMIAHHLDTHRETPRAA